MHAQRGGVGSEEAGGEDLRKRVLIIGNWGYCF